MSKLLPPRARRAHRGAAAVEFAICLALGLLPVIMAIMEWSWYFFQQTSVQQALIASARVAAQIDMPDDCPDTVFLAEFEERLDAMHITVGTDDIAVLVTSDEYGSTGETIYQINASYSAEYVPLLDLPWNPSTMGASFVLPVEDQTDAPDCAS